ncbi:MAG: hypothetical protein ACSHWW_03165 [Nonlabens sp.]|uniref:hypothetical protein n=1 Tax=Nonlabens sp. TaxID=1888209 RepID=UPI003EF6E9A5
MKNFLFLVTLILTSFNFTIAQDSDPAYADFKEIDDTEFKDQPSFYVVDLKMTASDPGMATASWEAHKSLTKFLVELYDPTTNVMFHRKIYREKTIQIPASARVTIAPIHLNMKGKPKSTTLSLSNYATQAEQRKNIEQLMKQMEQQQNYGNSYNNSSSSEIPWRWILRGIGLLALVIGLIAKFAGKSDNEFKDYDRRNRKP